MFTNLNVFALASSMAAHAGQRQTVIAQNVANADTPGYQARDIQAFSTVIRSGGAESGMRASRAGHLDQGDNQKIWSIRATDADADPNDNTVSLELEMLKAADVKLQQDRALAIYKSALTVLRTSLGRV